MSARLDYRDS